jgi:hypothetical protein
MRLRISEPIGQHLFRRLSHGVVDSTSRDLPALRAVALAIGAVALGAVAIGALAIGAVAIGRLAVGRARIRRLQIDELVVRQLRVTEALHVPPKPEPDARS